MSILENDKIFHSLFSSVLRILGRHHWWWNWHCWVFMILVVQIQIVELLGESVTLVSIIIIIHTSKTCCLCPHRGEMFLKQNFAEIQGCSSKQASADTTVEMKLSYWEAWYCWEWLKELFLPSYVIIICCQNTFLLSSPLGCGWIIQLSEESAVWRRGVTVRKLMQILTLFFWLRLMRWDLLRIFEGLICFSRSCVGENCSEWWLSMLKLRDETLELSRE